MSGAATASFVYDGDGNRTKNVQVTRVKGTVGGVTTTYIGNYLEWTGSTSTMKRYYYAGSTRVTMRMGSSTLNYILGDHLGSTMLATDGNGQNFAEIRYYPWGAERYSSGTTPTSPRCARVRRWQHSVDYHPIYGWVSGEAFNPTYYYLW